MKSALKLLVTLAQASIVLETPAHLERWRSNNYAVDHLVFRSGNQCQRCRDIENAIDRIGQHITLPILVLKWFDNSSPEVHFQKWDGTSATYDTVKYDGQFTLTGMLQFAQRMNRAGLQRCLLTGSENLRQNLSSCCESSATCFVGSFPSEDNVGIVQFVKSIQKLGKGLSTRRNGGIEFRYTLDANETSKYGSVTVIHPNQVLLRTAVSTVDQLADWMRSERLPIFGRLTSSVALDLSMKDPDAGWIVLVGNDNNLRSYELYEHEFRLFCMLNRSDWHCAYLNIENVNEKRADDRVDWKALQLIANTSEDIKDLVERECLPECVLIRKSSVLRAVRKTSWSHDELLSLTAELDRSSQGVHESAELLTSASHDLGIENDKVKQRAKNGEVIRITQTEFDILVNGDPGPLLLLLHQPNEELSQSLRRTFDDVVRDLKTNGFKFYEMTALPESDTRYQPQELPHLYLKPFGVRADPLTIPWREDMAQTTAAVAREFRKRETGSVRDTLVDLGKRTLTYLANKLLRRFHARENLEL